MNFYIIIPAHNEAEVIAQTLQSLTEQTLQAKQIVVVNDNSSDHTQQIVEEFTRSHSNISLINNQSSNKHLPGSKIINAFYKGYDTLDADYDVICKFDADLIFPENYLERLAYHFTENNRLGMAAGFCYIKKENQWVLENLTSKDHIRGALKAYRNECFEAIGQLKVSMGWDTVDELLARYHGWELLTDDTLKVKHLRPTGISYNKASKYLQGEAMYKMRYGFLITLISAVKLAWKKGSFRLFINYISGYFRAKQRGLERLVTKSEGKFIRQLRWKGIRSKFS